jgi:hypothetical protein
VACLLALAASVWTREPLTLWLRHFSTLPLCSLLTSFLTDAAADTPPTLTTELRSLGFTSQQLHIML